MARKKIKTSRNAPIILKGDTVYADRNDKNLSGEGWFLVKYGKNQNYFSCEVFSDPDDTTRFFLSFHNQACGNIGWTSMTNIEVVGRLVRISRMADRHL